MFDDRRPDAALRYRTDDLGRRVALFPATCKVGAHLLASGFVAREDTQDGVVRVSCTTCAEYPDPDHFWVLATSGGAPDRAEFTDDPYTEVRPAMVLPRSTPDNRAG